jgi:LysR family nitrogen assimilation transcriptional regulator
MNLRDLRYFVAVAESGSILAASEKLHVAQPSISVRIRALEGDLGVTLFERRPRGVVKTAEGEELLAHARMILGAAETARENLRRHATSPVGTVTFGVPTSLCSVLAVPLIEQTLTALPNVRLKVIESMSGYIVDWRRGGQIDVGLIFADAPISGVQAEPLLVEELHLAAGTAKALKPLVNKAGEVPMAALAEVPLFLPTDRHGLRTLIDQHLRRHGVGSRVIIEIDAFLQIQRLVQRGHGMTILSLAALQKSDLSPPLHTARIVRPTIPRTVSVAHVDGRPLTKASREVARLAATVLRQAATEPWWSARLA